MLIGQFTQTEDLYCRSISVYSVRIPAQDRETVCVSAVDSVTLRMGKAVEAREQQPEKRSVVIRPKGFRRNTH